MANKRTYSDQIVWITGASSGIGDALAREFAAAGARLILSARREDALQSVAASCVSRYPIDIVPLDLAELQTLTQIADNLLSRHGRIDVMVHNAGVAHRALAIETPLAIDQRIMDTNYFGPILLTKALLPGMIKRGAGQFIVVSSLSGKYGAPRGSAYAASKHALHGFFESLRTEVHVSGIRITIVVPGFIRTSITAHALTGTGEEYGKMLSVHEKAMAPDQCAARILAAAAASREEVLVGKSEILTVYLNRFFPGLLSRLVRSHPIRTRDRWLARLHLLPRKPES